MRGKVWLGCETCHITNFDLKLHSPALSLVNLGNWLHLNLVPANRHPLGVPPLSSTRLNWHFLSKTSKNSKIERVLLQPTPSALCFHRLLSIHRVFKLILCQRHIHSKSHQCHTVIPWSLHFMWSLHELETTYIIGKISSLSGRISSNTAQKAP